MSKYQNILISNRREAARLIHLISLCHVDGEAQIKQYFERFCERKIFERTG